LLLSLFTSVLAAAIFLETWVHVYNTKWPDVPEHILTDREGVSDLSFD